MPLSSLRGTLYTRAAEFGGETSSSLDIDGLSDIGEAIADSDLFIIDNGGGGTNAKTAVTRIPTYVFSGVSGAITINSSGVAAFPSTVEATNLTLSGDLTVNGSTVSINTSTVTIDDPMFALADNNSADTVDIGWYGKYVDSGTKYSGLVRDASDSDMWKLFATTGNSHEAPTTTVNTSSGFTLANLSVNELTGTIATAAQTNITSLGTLTGLTLDGDKSVTPGDGAMIHVDTSTITDSNTSGSGTATKYSHVTIEAPTLAATNASVTTSDVATLYINAAATAGTNQTITRNWAMWVDTGNARFDGSIYSGTTEALSSAGLVTVANQSNITGVGTITSGTWEGTTVAVDQGGTGATSLNNLITLTTHTTGNYVSAITGGTGIDSTGATSGEGVGHTLSLDLSELTDTAIANGDYIVFTDTTDSNATVKGDLADVATLFAGTGLTASSSVIGVDASQTQITAVGTIATGVWQGTDVGVSHGGTGASTATAGFDALSPMTAEGDVLYGGASGTVTKLAKGSDGEFLKLASGVPTWGTVSAGTASGLDTTSSSANLPVAKITNTHADATAGYLQFIKDPGSGQGADNDILGTISFLGTDASNNAPEELARIESYVVEADHGSEAGGMKFYVAENDATVTTGLHLQGQASDDGEIDVTIGAGAASTTTIAGTLTMGTTAAMTNAGLVSVANQSGITGLGTISSGTWEGTTVAVAQGGTGATTLNNLITLATHTTGDYVQNITAGTGLTSTGATSGENIAHSLSVDASQTGITAIGTIATGTWEATDIGVAHGGTGVSSLTANAILTGNGTSAIQAETDLLFSSNKLIPTATAHNAAGTALTMSAGATTAGTTDNIAGGALTFQGGQGKGSGAGGAIIFQTANAGGSGSSLNSLATALTINDDGSLTTASTIELGHATDTTIARSGSGDITIEGNAVYRAGGTDVAIADGGTGAGTATAGFDALSPMTAEGDILYGGSSGTVTKLAKGSDADVLTLASGVPSWATPTTGDITGVTAGNGLSGGGSSGGVSLALDLSELTDTAIANGDYIVFTDTTDSNATVKGDLADVATLFAGTGLTASSSVIGVDASQTQITAVGTIATGTWEATDVAVAHGGTGASSLTTNAVLTGNGTSAIQAETDLLFSSNKLIPTASAHDAAGTALTMSAGSTTAGTTDNIAGGALTLQGGQGKGSGAGGAIIFQTANEGGSGSSLNSLATALTLSDDLSATFGGNVVVPTGATVGPVGDTDLVTLTASGNIVTVAGELSATTLDIGGTNISSTAGELNLLDGSAKSTSSITIADTDAFVVIDGTTTKQIPASDIPTYVDAPSKGFAIAMAVAL